MLKNLPAMHETWVQSLGQEDPLEKEMATHSSILAWRIPWTEEPGGLQSMGSQRVRHNWTFFTEPEERVRLRPFSGRRKITLTSLWFQIRIQFLMRCSKGWSRALCMDPLRQYSSSSSLSSLCEYQIKTHQQALPKVCYIYFISFLMILSASSSLLIQTLTSAIFFSCFPFKGYKFPSMHDFSCISHILI